MMQGIHTVPTKGAQSGAVWELEGLVSLVPAFLAVGGGRGVGASTTITRRPETRHRGTEHEGRERADHGAAARILVVDDNSGILDNFRRILGQHDTGCDELEALDAVLFEEEAGKSGALPTFELEALHDGRAACARVQEARLAGQSFAVAFVDMRMPGGWSGLETIKELWRVDPDIEVVICTAYSDFGWLEISGELGRTDQLLILRKPFEVIEVQQLATALSEKWFLRREARRQMDSLQGLVDARTQELQRTLKELETANARMGIALEAAEGASKAKSAFLSAMSHELRTPLNAVIGFSEMLSMESFGPLGDERYRDYAQTIADSGRHLLGLINDILDLSKMDAGRLSLDETELDLRELSEECLRIMGAQAAKARIDLQMDIEEDLPLLRADERRLRQVLLNILSNATKFTPEGGQVLLSAFSEDSRIVVQIADSGIGMAPEDIPRAVEQFCQIDNTINRSFSGTGLGLPLSKGLVELHGGSLDIESNLGVGTTITVGFPRDRVVRQSPVR